LVGGTRQANRLRGDADATRVENAHRDRETLAFRPEHVLLRAYVVAELDLASRRRANAELGLGLAGMETGARRVDDERRNALGTDARRGDREQHDVLRDGPRGDPALLAVDDPVAVRVPRGARVHRRRDGPG